MTAAEREAVASAVRWAIHLCPMPDSMTTGERVEVRRVMKVAAAEGLADLWSKAK